MWEPLRAAFSHFLCLCSHTRLELVWALPGQTCWLLPKAEIRCLTTSDNLFDTINCMYPSHHSIMSSKFHLANKQDGSSGKSQIYAHLTWNTCRRLYKLSIEVRNDCIAFFCWLHPEIIKDTKSISDVCSEKGLQLLCQACFLSGGLLHYLRAYMTNMPTCHGFNVTVLRT